MGGGGEISAQVGAARLRHYEVLKVRSESARVGTLEESARSQLLCHVVSMSQFAHIRDKISARMSRLDTRTHLRADVRTLLPQMR